MINLFPPNTKIKDFGYPESHPFHLGNYPLLSPSTSSSSSSDDDDSLYKRHNNSYNYYNNDDDYHHHDNSKYINHNGHDKDVEQQQQGDDDNDDDLIDIQMNPDEINCKARAIFDFNAENDNEISLIEGQIIWISYRHGQGWLVAEDPENGENGLVPEEYVEIIREIEEENHDDEEDVPKRFMLEIFGDDEQEQQVKEEDDSEWVDTDTDDNDAHDHDNDDKEINKKLKNIKI